MSNVIYIICEANKLHYYCTTSDIVEADIRSLSKLSYLELTTINISSSQFKGII